MFIRVLCVFLISNFSRPTRLNATYCPVLSLPCHGSAVLLSFAPEASRAKAVAFIERHRQHPFFPYRAFNATHAPLQATEKYFSRFASIADEKRRTYAAMTSVMDDAGGAVLAKLKSAGLEEITLLFFFSDNGGPRGLCDTGRAERREMDHSSMGSGSGRPAFHK